MSNPIWAMLIGVGVGLAVSLYVYYQEQRNNGQSYGNGRAPNRGDPSMIDWERPDPAATGSRGRRTRTSRRNDSPESKSKEPCIICMDEKSNDAWRILSCEHRFHVKCIATWFNEKRSCPTCRSAVGSSNWA